MIRAVLGDAGAEFHQHRMPAPVHVEHLLARQADLDRPPERQRGLQHDRLVVADVGLAAEAPAVRARDDAQVRLGHPQHARHLPVHVMRDLCRRPERELALAVDCRDGRVLLDRQVRVALEEEQVLEHVVRRGERRLHVAELVGLVAVDVAVLVVLVDAHLGMRERLFRRGDRQQRLVPDVDEAERLVRGLLVPRDHRGQRIADVPHALRRKRVFVGRHRHDAERDREIAAGENEMHAGVLRGAGGVDRKDARVRVRRAQELRVQHARQHDVVGEARLPGHLGAAVDAAARLADHVEARLRAHRPPPPAGPVASGAAPSSRILRAASSIDSQIC